MRCAAGRRDSSCRADSLDGRKSVRTWLTTVVHDECASQIVRVRYLAVATDYDGTLAEQGTVRPETVAAVERLRKSGRRVVLVTGRELRDLQTVFDRFDLFDLVVAENGALLYRPQTREEKCVAEPPPPALAERLRERGATPVGVGRVIVATREPHEVAAVEAVRELGLEWQVIFNKGAVMLLPSGVNKQTGLATALSELGLSMRNTVAVGRSEEHTSELQSPIYLVCRLL